MLSVLDGTFCPHCGSATRPGDTRCLVCGAQLSQPAEPPGSTAGAPAPRTDAPPQTTSAAPSTPTPPAAPAASSAQPTPGGAAPSPTTPYGPYQPYGGAAPSAPGPAYPGYPPQAYPPSYSHYPPQYRPQYPPQYPPAYPPYAPGGAANRAPAPYTPYPYPYQPQPPQPQPPTRAPGQPVYPQGQAPQYPYSAYPYPYPYPQQYWAYPYPAPVVKRRAPGEIYGLVVAWIVFSLGILSIVGGLLLLLIGGLAAVSGAGDSLATLTTFAGFTLGPILGGVLAIVYGISKVLKRPSPPPSLPPTLVMLALSIIALGAGVALWHFYVAPGLAFAILPLALLAGFLPAFTILAYGVRQLGASTTRRRFWLSLFFGATMAPLFAIIFEAIASLLILFGLRIIRPDLTPGISNLTNTAPENLTDVIFMLLVLSVVAPLVEEGLKPLGVVLIMRRLRSPAEAFLLGLAAGIGFNLVETVGYIGSGEADWISIAIQRIGAGLLHGLGAAMAAFGWYYLINGKGMPRRWLLGFGGLAYAVLQHGIFNGSNLLGLLPGPIGDLMSKTVYLGNLPLDSGTILFFSYYVIILGILVYMTTRLRRDLNAPPRTTPGTAGAAPTGSAGAEPQPVAGGAR